MRIYLCSEVKAESNFSSKLKPVNKKALSKFEAFIVKKGYKPYYGKGRDKTYIGVMVDLNDDAELGTFMMQLAKKFGCFMKVYPAVKNPGGLYDMKIILHDYKAQDDIVVDRRPTYSMGMGASSHSPYAS